MAVLTVLIEALLARLTLPFSTMMMLSDEGDEPVRYPLPVRGRPRPTRWDRPCWPTRVFVLNEAARRIAMPRLDGNRCGPGAVQPRADRCQPYDWERETSLAALSARNLQQIFNINPTPDKAFHMHWAHALRNTGGHRWTVSTHLFSDFASVVVTDRWHGRTSAEDPLSHPQHCSAGGPRFSTSPLRPRRCDCAASIL